MAHDDKTYGPVTTTFDGERISFVSRSDAGGEVSVLVESVNGSYLSMLLLDRTSAHAFDKRFRDACLDAFGDPEWL